MGFFKQSAKINVVYKNGVKDRISPALLTTLLASRQIQKFERRDGWAQVGTDPIRAGGCGDYPGDERRAS